MGVELNTFLFIKVVKVVNVLVMLLLNFQIIISYSFPNYDVPVFQPEQV